MLAVSGLLSKKMYGPPVMPLQPEGVWQVVYNGDRWETSQGEDRYRRALYTLWRRTSPYPAMTTFDAPSGEVCTLRRMPTNTPLQALVTLNDPLALEAAEHLAGRAREEAGGDVDQDDRERAYMLALARKPAEAEVARLRQALRPGAQRSARRRGFSARVDPRRPHHLRARAQADACCRPRAKGPQMWRSTTVEPAAKAGNSRGFDASAWPEAAGFFGHIPKEPIRRARTTSDEEPRAIRTSWDSERIWLRREFELDATPLEQASTCWPNTAAASISGSTACPPPIRATKSRAAPRLTSARRR